MIIINNIEWLLAITSTVAYYGSAIILGLVAFVWSQYRDLDEPKQ